METKPKLSLLIPPFIAICVILALVIFKWGPETVSRDFTGFYASARMLVECPHSLYDTQAQLEYQKALGIRQNFLPFPYPALVPLIFVPFTWVSLNTAYWLMLAVNLGLLFLGLAMMIRRYELKQDEAKTLLLVASTAFPIFTTLVAGQFAFVILLLIAMFFADLKKDRPSAGIWAGALVVKPSLLAVPLLILLLGWKKRALAAAGVTGAVIIGLSGMLVGWKGLGDQIALLMAMGRHPAALANVPFMHNLRALSHWLHFGDAGALILSGLVMASLCLIPRSRRSSPPFMIASLIAIALVSPHLHTYDLPILLPLVALGVPTGIWYQRAYVFVPLGILLFTYRFGPVPLIPIVLLALFFVCVLRARRAGRLPWPDSPEPGAGLATSPAIK